MEEKKKIVVVETDGLEAFDQAARLFVLVMFVGCIMMVLFPSAATTVVSWFCHR